VNLGSSAMRADEPCGGAQVVRCLALSGSRRASLAAAVQPPSPLVRPNESISEPSIDRRETPSR